MFNIYATYRLAGAFSVQETARLVGRYHYLEAQLMRVAAGKLASLPEWEVKCLLGRHLWQDALHADALLARLIDLRWPRKAPLNPGESTVRLMALLDEAPTTQAFLHAIYRILKPALMAAYTAHMEAAAPLADEPTCLLLQGLVSEVQQQVYEGEALLGSLSDQDAPHLWLQDFTTAYEQAGRFGVPQTDVERELNSSFAGQAIQAAPPVAARDARFHMSVDGFNHSLLDGHEQTRFMAHRDADNEMHAAELLGRSIYEHPEMPWEYHVDMARQCWDEVRHAVLYQKYLESLGGRLGEFPVVPGNYAYRMGLSFEQRLYDLHLRGEKLGMPDLIRFRESATARGDHGYALLNDYVHADEVPHVKNGRWLHWLLQNDTQAFARIERETMQRRAAYEQEHPDDPLLQAYTGISQAVLHREVV